MQAVQQVDLAIPTLPSRSIDATVAFYKRLGFEGGAHQFNNACVSSLASAGTARY